MPVIADLLAGTAGAHQSWANNSRMPLSGGPEKMDLGHGRRISSRKGMSDNIRFAGRHENMGWCYRGDS